MKAALVAKALLSLLTAFLGYSILNISQATQKIRLSIFAKNRVGGGAVWLGGTLFMVIATFVIDSNFYGYTDKAGQN